MLHWLALKMIYKHLPPENWFENINVHCKYTYEHWAMWANVHMRPNAQAHTNRMQEVINALKCLLLNTKFKLFTKLPCLLLAALFEKNRAQIHKQFRQCFENIRWFMLEFCVIIGFMLLLKSSHFFFAVVNWLFPYRIVKQRVRRLMMS